VQTLTTSTVFPCYAPSDRELARSLAGFLERGADVQVFLEDGEMRPGETLVSKARDARTADLVIVLFSRTSMPSRWPRAQWEDPLVNEPAAEGVRIAFLRCDDCVPPKVLAPQFTAKQFRELKRWIRGHEFVPFRPDGDLEVLGIALADRPGVEFTDSADLAARFAREFRHDFDGVFTLQCGSRNLAALAGDLAAQIGLRLEGPVSENLQRLREFCESRRFLIVLEEIPDLAPAELVFGGKCSTLAANDARDLSLDTIREIQESVCDPATPYADVAAAARRGRRLLRDAGRIAELYELMQAWHSAAADEEDRNALDESAREQIWILETWGRADEARSLDYDRAARFEDQMLLFDTWSG
jgi:hypothetical protein